MSVPSNLIPTRVTQLPVAPVADENSLMMIVYQGNNYQIRVGDLLSVAGVPVTRQVIAGTGLQGGGQLSSNVTLSIAPGGVGSTELSATGVAAGSYGSATTIPVFTVDSTGRVTAAGSVPVVVSGYVPESRQVIAGSGLTGGGALNTNVTLNANLSNSTPLVLDDSGSPGVSTEIARADHQHPAVDLSDQQQINGVLPLDQGGTSNSLVPNAGAIVWSGADGLYIGPAGTLGQVLTSGASGEYVWANIATDAPQPPHYVWIGPTSGPNATPSWRALVNSDIPTDLDITSVKADYFQVDTAATVTEGIGKLRWNANTETIAFGIDTNQEVNIGQQLFALVHNADSVTITRGQAVYLYQATGDKASVKLASNVGDATSAKTLGLVTETIAPGGNGFVITQGVLDKVNTSAFAEGATLYLGATAGSLTSTKPQAPNHLVYIGVVERSNAGNGQIYVRTQNGYELDEIHDVRITNVQNNDLLQYNSSGPYWQNVAASSTTIGIATNLAGGLAGSVPYQTGPGATTFLGIGAANRVLTSTGTAPQWVTSLTGLTELQVDNLNLNGNTLSSTDANGDISLTPNGNGSVVITSAGTSNALRITQTGTGNALLVEDAANPDATPFVINADGRVGIGVTPSAGRAITLAGSSLITGATSAFGFLSAPTINSDVTSDYTAFRGVITTAAASFNLNTAIGLQAVQGTLGAGSSISNLIGFEANSSLIGATNNYGFYSNIASGTGRWNFYASGTADNYFAGRVGIGGPPNSFGTLFIERQQTGQTTNDSVTVTATVASDVTSTARGYQSRLAPAAASFTLSSLVHFYANPATFGAGATVTNQLGFYAESTLTGATNNFGFYSNIASGTGRWNFYANGTARNYFAGNTGIGADSGTAIKLFISGNATGSANQIGFRSNETIQSDVTTSYQGVDSLLSTQATSFTLTSYNAYRAGLSSLGAGSALSTVTGYLALSNLAVGTNNYAFRGQFASAANTFNLYMDGTADNFFGGPTTISVNSSSNALRITQVGTGNALVVEDSANPDATPFVVDTNGRLVIGNTSGDGSPLSIYSTSDAASYYRFVADTFGPFQYFSKSRSGTIGTNTVVLSGDSLGGFIFRGADGTNYIAAASISSAVDGTPGTNDMPGRLVFSTTADGASTPTERMRIDSAGNVGIGGIATTVSLYNVKNITGGAFAYAFSATNAIQSDVTSTAAGYHTALSTADAVFTLSNLRHFWANQGTVTGGSRTAPTNQFGFSAASSLTGATNNYGFYSDIASGTGRWNFYANGSADNYFGGSLALGGTTTPGASGMSLRVGLPMTGVSNEWVGILNNGQVRSGVTGNAYMYRSVLDTQAASFTLTNQYHYHASQSSIGAGSAVTNQYGFVVDSTLVGATNNFGFFSAVPSGTNRWNFYAAGTAQNYFEGLVGLKTTANNGGYLEIGGTANVASNIGYGITQYQTIPSTATSGYQFNTTFASTAAASFTVPEIRHYNATQGTFGLGSSVTNQYAYFAAATLTGAANNFGFFSNIASGTGRWNFYANGTAANHFSGDVRIFGAGGLGYTTGSGGAVTQGTSRTQGVTLDKTNGAITLFSAAGTTTWQSFTVTNNTVAATDTIIVNQKSGTDLYMIHVTNVAAGSFRITFATTGGTTTEQPVFNFAVIKAVTA